MVQEYKPGHENAIIHDQLTEESNVPDQAERLVLVTRMIVQVLVVFKPQKTPNGNLNQGDITLSPLGQLSSRWWCTWLV